MKIFLNLNQLSMSWNEKQKPQRFRRYAAMLLLLLTLGVGQMWGTDLYVRGNHNSWAANSASKMTGTSSPWTYTAYWSSNTEFKISTSDWAKPNLGGNGSVLNLSWSTKASLYNDGGSKNIKMPTLPTGGGIYTITVTLESGTYKIQVDKVVEEGKDWKDITDPTVYFDNSAASYSNVSVVMGRVWGYGVQAQGYKAVTMSNISNTSLYYTQSIDNASGDASKYTTMLFANASMSGWTGSKQATQGVVDKTSYTNTSNNDLNSNTFLFKAASGDKGASLTKTDLTSYSDLNKTQTIEVYVKVGSGSYTKRTSSWPGTLTPDRYYLSNATTATHVNNTALTAGSSVTVSAVLTSAFSLSESSTADGYNFDGWGTSSSSTPSGKNAAYSISSITGANTICAFFTAPSYSITYNLNGGTQQVSPAPATSYTVESSAITLPTPSKDGYDFDGWYDNDGLTGDAVTTIPAGSTGNKEYWAKWTEASTYYDVTFGVHESGNGTLTAVKTVNSASITSGDDLLSGTAITFTATPSSYYEVEGWYTNSACTLGKHDAGETTYSVASLGSDITVYVKFKPITYNITYNLNSGTNNPGNPATYTYESSAITLQDPTRDGYTFGGWYTEVGLTNRVYSIAAGSNGNKAFWAKWTEKMTTVTLVSNPSGAGTFTVGSSPGQTSTTAGVTTTRSITAVPEVGYFVKTSATVWSKDNSNITLSSTTANPVTVTGGGSGGTSTLTGKFERTYAYIEGRMTVYNAARSTETHVGSSKGKWSESSFNIAMDYDATNHRFYRHTYKTPAELSATQTDGTAQSQWFSIARSNASGSWSGKTTYHPSSNTDLTTAGIGQKKAAQTSTTTANYKFNSSATDGYAILYFDEAGVWYELEHTLKYDGNGNTGGSAPAATTYYNDGTNATAASNSYTMTRYSFAGWNTNQYITGTTYAVGASVPMTTNRTLYAIWTRSVTLEQEDATTEGSTSFIGKYNCATLPTITNPAKNGYEFGGWYTEEAGNGSFVINTSGVLQAGKYHWTDADGRFVRNTGSEDKPLYAKWTQTVTLDANTDNHGSGSNKSATIVYKATDKSSITHCTPATGYHLVGYYTAATDGVKVLNADGSFASSAVTDYITDGKWTKAGATTLYAHYEANTYTIAFDPNDDQYVGEATGSMDDQAATWGNYPTLTSNGFTREGYTFAGWATSPTGVVVYSNGQTLSTNLTNDNNATVTLYAKWTGKTYTVTFNARGGSGLTPTSKNVTMGSAYGELATVTPPAGYIFDGWYTSAGGGTKVTSATQVTTAVDHTLYAHYIQKAQVYFKNTLGWSQVWVTYDANWDGTQGTGNEGKTYHQMKLVSGTTDIYYDDIPDEYITSWRWNIAFNNLDYSSTPFYAFDNGEAVYRMDFDKKATMFVPTSNTGSTADGNYQKHGVQYRSTGYPAESSGPKYTSGYWRTYNNTYSGYTMTYQKNTEGGTWHGGHKMESAKVGDNVFCFTVNMEANSQYNFSFYKNYNVNWKSIQFCYNPSTQINSSNCTNLQLDCNPNNSYMQTTVAGEYTFQLEMKADGHMYLSVIYPLAVGDFRVRYDYTKGSAKTYYSEIIKGRANGKDTISVFIHSADSASSRVLKIEKCTTITSGSPSWNTSYAAIDLPAKTAAGQTYDGKTTSGVYDFIITQDGSAAASGAYWDKYTGNYYIRTDVSDGGWDLYKYRTDNIMTLSEYSLTQTLSAPYSHYYCRFIGSTSVDITYAVATDYSPNISGTMIGDETIGGVGNRTLPATANVRFTWNMETNALRRAYLKNAQNENERFLVLHGKADDNIFNNDASGTEIAADPGRSLAKNELLFEDLGNWIYQVELKAKPNAAVSLIAKYNNADRYLIGSASSWMTIMGGSGSAKYEILAVYDFKTNRLMTVWKPSGDITQTLSDVDVLLIRHAQEAGQTITFNGGSLTTKKVYGALEFRYSELVGHVANWTSSSRPLMKFFISFPFDVNVSDIFGLNSAYGDAYEIQMYDGAERARKGFFRGDGTTTFWKTLQPGDVMKANEGYCVIMDNDYLNNDVGHVWDNKGSGSKVYLYFPSAGNVGSIASTSQTISIPSRPCTIDRTFTTHQGSTREVNHMNTDSHWNMMGVPIFANTIGDATAGTPGAVFATSGTDGDGNFNYYYQWDPTNNQFAIHTAIGETFKSMHSYMVQYHGNVTFTGAHPTAAVAARRGAEKKNYQIELQVLSGDEVMNRAYVELRENACDTFALNEDVYMSFNNLAVNIYTLAGNYDVAANVLSVGNHTIPVGVKVTKAGTYTFSMPSNFSGTATLVDSFTGERTNLALDDYEVNLQKGVIEDRFLLEIDVQKVATAIDGASGEGSLKDGKAHKFLQNNTLYILQNGVLYDARGARVQ